MSGKLGEEFEGRILSEPPVSDYSPNTISIPWLTAFFADVANGALHVKKSRFFCSVRVPLKDGVSPKEVSEIARAANPHLAYHDANDRTLAMKFALGATNGDPLHCGDWQGASMGSRLRGVFKRLEENEKAKAEASGQTENKIKPPHFAEIPWLEVTAG